MSQVMSSESQKNPMLKQKQIIIHTVSDARKWVNQLPLTDMGEVTRQLFQTITALNQSSLKPSVRIDIAEILLPYVKMALDNLDRHFYSRTFPLPERSQKIYELKKALLLETAGSYQLAALNMLTNHFSSKKKLLLSIGRAVRYMCLVLMISYEIYAESEKSLWHDIHHMFLLACENGIENKILPNKADDQDEEMSIEDNYKLINLIALAAPNTLRQGEAVRIRHFYKQHVNEVKLLCDASKVKSKYAHVALMNSDEPASLMPIGDLVSSATSRIFDLSQVINRLDKFVIASDNTDLGKHKSQPMLTHTLAKRLVYALTTIRNRRFKRFPRDEKATLAIKLADVVELIRDNDLETFYDQVNEKVEDDNIYEALTEEGEVSSPWADIDVVGLAEERDVVLQTWKMSNSSSGGYGMRQIKAEASTARVGELVAIKDPKDINAQWQIAVIRWMDACRQIGLNLGFELLSQHGMTVEVTEITNREITQNLPVKGVFLPTIDGVRDEANFIFPSFIFKEEDELTLILGRREQRITITAIDDTVGNFSYCSFDYRDIKDAEEGSMESFDDIWDFL